MTKQSTDPYSVYLIKNTKNEKVYVGITSKGVARRMSRHLRQAKSGSECLIHRAMRKHGASSFSIETVDTGLSADDAAKKEIALIADFNADAAGGYNILAGGQTGVSSRPQLTRKRKSDAAKSAWLKSEAWKKAIHSPSRLLAIGRASKANFERPEYRKKFEARHQDMVRLSKAKHVRAKALSTRKGNGFCVVLRCSNGMTFESAADAARWAGAERGVPCHLTNILACAKGRKASAYGHTWEIISHDGSDG